MTQKGTLEVRVECYAGYRGEESPRRFFLGKRPIEISEIVDRWLDPRCRYFKVRAGDGEVYILRHDTETGIWEMTLFSADTRPESRLSST